MGGGSPHSFHGKKGPGNLSRASIVGVFKNIILPRKKLLMLGLGLILINRLASLALPLSSKYLFDNVIGQKDLALLKLLLLVVGSAVLIQAVTTFFLTRVLSVEAYNLIYQLRVKLQKKILRMPIRFFDENPTGTLVSRIMSDVEGVRNLIGRGLVQLFGGLLTAVVAFGFLLSINPTMTGAVFLPLLIFGIITMMAFSRIRPIFRDRGAINAEVTGRLTEALNGIRVLKGFNAEAREEKIFEDKAQKLYLNAKRSLTGASLVISLGILVIGATTVIVLGTGGALIIKGGMTVGELVSFTFLLGFLVAPIVQITNVGTQITEAFAGLDRMQEMMLLSREGDNPGRTREIKKITQGIEFESVSFEYQKGEPVLHDVTLSLPVGTVTALVGSSGAGKSTVAALSAGFRKPSSGIVTIDGINLSEVKLDSFRSRLGVVLQDDFLFDGTLRENITFSSPNASEAKIREAVQAAHVNEFSDRFKDGLDTIIGERGVKLSGGQRQRLSIARAILAGPEFLIMDEATSDLDSESEMYIRKSLEALLRGRTVLIIAHRLSTIRRADNIIVMESGRIAEQGKHKALIAKKGRYYELYTYQAKI